MEDKDIDGIIARSLTGAITDEELKQLFAWRERSPENERHYHTLEQFWRTQYQEPRYIHASDLADNHGCRLSKRR